MDQEMKDQSNVQKEEVKSKGAEVGVSHSGASGLEGGIMPRMDLLKDFDDMQKSIFEDFSHIDQEMDRRFRNFSDTMFKNQELQIQEFKKEMEKQRKQHLSLEGKKQKELGSSQQQQLATKAQEGGQVANVSRHSYTKEHRQVETRALQIDKYRILYKLIDQTKEKDGVILPHIVRQIDCNPAASLDILRENALFEESLDEGKSQRLFTQFEKDTKDVDENKKPHRIIKYVNSILTEDPKNNESGKIFGVKVVYLNNNNDRLRYTFQKRQGETNPQINIERSSKLFSSFFF